MLSNAKDLKDFPALSRQILRLAEQSLPRTAFLCELSSRLRDFSACDVLELWVREGNRHFRCMAAKPRSGGNAPASVTFRVVPQVDAEDGKKKTCDAGAVEFDEMCRDIAYCRVNPTPPFFTPGGTFWTGAARVRTPHVAIRDGRDTTNRVTPTAEYPSTVIIPLEGDKERLGLLALRCKCQDFFGEDEIRLYEQMAQSITLALIHQETQAALRERIKELTCILAITQVSEELDLSNDEMLSRIVKLLPASWQYPEAASARIVMDGKHYQTPGFKETSKRQTAEIVVTGDARGFVEVAYSTEKPELDEGPFLAEERGLLEAIATQIALIVERRRAYEDKARLQEQLRHADRLATIGELAAGVAHELNEPLGNILGFAQLAIKSPELPEQSRHDIQRIVSASLYARQIIQKLMMFARQTPPRKTSIDLNQIVKEGLYFLERRCARQGIEVVKILDPALPCVTADAAQLHQVLVNLAVNALQAMPDGGRLILKTASNDDRISLIVEDTGTGMDESVLNSIFVPFFTTKEVGQGLGLGLSVVHGIVAGHGGAIRVESKSGEGSRFEVTLPIAAPEGEAEVEKG
jgi:two-component system NtrC family sensor kinase